MPVEIRELVIRAVVGEPPEQPRVEAPADVQTEAARQALIEECVRQVLKILQRRGER